MNSKYIIPSFIVVLLLLSVELLQAQFFDENLESELANLSGNELMKLGYRYTNGDGVEMNEEKAFTLFMAAIEKGEVRANYSIGGAYANGYGVEVDYEKAVEYYEIAAEYGVGAAQINLGWMHYMGRGVPVNYDMTFKWYQIAANKGVAHGQYLFALLYEQGHGTPVDLEQAKYWLEKAAAKGHSTAQQALNGLNAFDQDYESTFTGQFPLPPDY